MKRLEICLPLVKRGYDVVSNDATHMTAFVLRMCAPGRTNSPVYERGWIMGEWNVRSDRANL